MQLVQGRQIGLTTRFAVVCTFWGKKFRQNEKSPLPSKQKKQSTKTQQRGAKDGGQNTQQDHIHTKGGEEVREKSK